MNHSRLQVLLRIAEPPAWFQAAHYLTKQGEYTASELWELIRQGHSKEDDELLQAHKDAHPELWPKP